MISGAGLSAPSGDGRLDTRAEPAGWPVDGIELSKGDRVARCGSPPSFASGPSPARSGFVNRHPLPPGLGAFAEASGGREWCEYGTGAEEVDEGGERIVNGEW